jgi:hypothetical protein
MTAPLTTTFIAAAASTAIAGSELLVGFLVGLGLVNQLLVEYAASKVTDNGPG